MSTESDRGSGTAAALIIGFTIQGLAIARALRRQGIPVYAMERRSGDGARASRHPVFHTNHAEFAYFDNLLDVGLVEALLEYRKRIPEERVVLYPASDNTVAALAQHWEKLAGHYILSWAEYREEIAKIIQKGCLPSYCDSVGVRYPRTVTVRSSAEVGDCLERLEFPVLVKPNKPASSFKTYRCADAAELSSFVESESANWPLVVQEWVDGPDSSLYFYSSFLVDGEEYFGMTGRKVRASPPGMGRASVMETYEDDGVYAVSKQLLKAFAVSGPVALEFKKDREGRYWFIEANVGRTEFCIDLPIQAGFNVPHIEFQYALGRPLPEMGQLKPSIWYDTDKEPFSYFTLALYERTFKPHGKRQVFPYWGQERSVVIFSAFAWTTVRIIMRALRKVTAIYPSNRSALV